MQLYYTAFLDLTTCRGAAYDSEGPIQWSAIHLWSTAHGLSEEQREDLFFFVPRMDKTYLDFKAKKMKDAIGANK